ncbi:MAG: Sec-independent protein translocase subunit TatA/TatB [Flavobacteriaceae bacterium]
MQTHVLFISGVEIIFILFIVVMIFGADKLPEIARGLGKGMTQLRNATNEIKSEINNSAKDYGVDTELGTSVTKEINKVKDEFDDLTGPIKRRF